MLRAVVAFVLGAALAGGAAFALVRHREVLARSSCGGLCGEGTRCTDGRCLAIPTTVTAVGPNGKKRDLGHRTGVANGPKGIVILRPGDDQPQTVGDELGRPERVDLTKPGDDGRQLEMTEIDAVWAKAQSGISQCIATAIGDAPITAGTVDVGLRIEKGGEVSRVRVEAPRFLQKLPPEQRPPRLRAPDREGPPFPRVRRRHRRELPVSDKVVVVNPPHPGTP
jgi:hypothetical protein